MEKERSNKRKNSDVYESDTDSESEITFKPANATKKRRNMTDGINKLDQASINLITAHFD